MIETHFAPPERKPISEVRELAKRISCEHIVDTLLKGFGGIVIIINEQRQILAANSNLIEMLQLKNQDEIVGLRPGEAIHCIHATDFKNGCGTGPYCKFCGAVQCVLKVLRTNFASEGECLLNLGSEEDIVPMEFAIRAFPVYICHERLIVVLLRDIRVEKFNESLEQTFFHDIMNIIFGLVGYSEHFEYTDISEYPGLAKKIKLLSENLAEEVNFQRALRITNSKSYKVPSKKVSMAEIANKLNHRYGEYVKNQGKFLEVIPVSENLIIESDSMLINRILVNMVKNATEAIKKGDKVIVSCKSKDDSIIWEVWNSGMIPEDITPRIFQRFFSTKSSRGRGLGTYSMKLFGEHYLGGKIDFTTSKEEGTVFSFTLPHQVENVNSISK